MPVRLHQNKAINAISIENLAIGEYLDGDDGAKYVLFPGDPQGPVWQTRTNVPDNMVGDGKGRDRQSKPYYYDALNKPYSGALTNTIGARIFRMWLGGAITVTTNALPGTKDHSIAQLEQGDEPMVCNQIRSHPKGGARFWFGDVFTQTIEMGQQGSSQPRLTAGFSNGGMHKKLADTSIDVADIVAQPAYLLFDGKKTKVFFYDGTTNYDWAGDKMLLDVSFTGNQDVQVEQIPGDEAVDPDNECEGGYTQNLSIGSQTASMRVKVYMDANFAVFDAWKANKKLTSVRLIFATCEKIGLTTHNAELEVKFPIGEFNMEPDTQNNKDAYAFNIKAIEGDAVTGSLVIGRVRMVGDLDVTLP